MTRNRVLGDERGHDRVRSSPAAAFTLVEMLVVVAVIAIALGLALPVLTTARNSGRKTAEMSAARQLMLAYLGYAGDHRAAVLPGYRAGLRADDDRGRPLSGEAAARYPWRLAPYLDDALEALFVGRHRAVMDTLRNRDEQYSYEVSLSPSLGLNSAWLGGDQSELGFSDRYEEIFGRFYVTALGEVRRPSRLMVFASARGEDPLVRGQGAVEGYFRVTSPRLTAARGDRWSEGFQRDEPPARFGFVSPRYDGLAVVAMVDAHVDVADAIALRDMRAWANDAKTNDFALAPGE